MRGTFSLVTAPTVEPITKDEVKLHLRLDADSAEEDARLRELYPLPEDGEEFDSADGDDEPIAPEADTALAATEEEVEEATEA